MKISLSLGILAILGAIATLVQQLILTSYGVYVAILYSIFPLFLIFGALLTIADYIDKKERQVTAVG